MKLSFDPGDCYVNRSGDIVEIIRSGACSVRFHIPSRKDLPPESLTYSEAIGLVQSGAWKWHDKKARSTEPRCRKCGELNEFQSGPFTCWRCANGI